MNLNFELNAFKEGFRHSRIFNLTGSSAALLLSLCESPFLAIESTEERAEELFNDIAFFKNALKGNPILFLPEPDGPSLAGERARGIYSLDAGTALVTSFRNLKSPVWSREELRRRIIPLRKKMEISRAELEERLRVIGYRSVSLVSEKGEFSRRGWLFDIFPSTGDNPLRLEFFGDEVESIKGFDTDTQRSTGDIPAPLIFPAGEPETGISLLDLMADMQFFISDSIQERDGLPPDAVSYSRYSILVPGYDPGVLPLKGLGILPEERQTIEDLPKGIANLLSENRISIIASSQGQAERLKDILRDGGIVAPVIDAPDIFTYEGAVSIMIGNLSSGFHIPGFLILTEKEVFGGRPGYRSLRKSKIAKLLTSLDDITPGGFVVHKDHGIGRFHGIVQQETEGVNEDLMLIEYEGGRLYLPLQGINRITRYHAEEGVIPRIDRLGGKTWQKTKERVKRKIRDLAEKLISLYAEREVSRGFSFNQDTELHREFDSFFSYEETPDQIQAIEDIKKDMESDRPMDRLICGDVGYGKTEVAMRAVFKAVYDGTQVAVLVPTTILCEQHYRTFKTRFSAFPVTVDFLSRFKSVKEQKKVIRALAHGDVDIIIGTHVLLGNNIGFHDLGLLVIDEEHRFGVRQKEKIKELKKGVDVITLTATPIPRTLHMALSSIREMSVIETPPEERLAVKSVVSVFDGKLITEAITREIERNGQVFFVHNRIRDIYKIADYIKRILPELRIAVAHGQMEERALEKAMFGFYAHETDVLVSTAIIGSGLDIPTANTIIINRADMMGLADLYQLRGRVGRAKLRAYAYFLIPGEDSITDEARKRLQAIQEMSYLGAGFRLALKDLEIRGAGNLLGAEQSGHIHAVGFDLYMEMLEKAVAELKGEKIEEEFETAIKLKVAAYIPESYIDDITLRLSLYRRIGASRRDEEISTITDELSDRFGMIPGEVMNLLNIMRLRIMAKKLLVAKIQESNGWVNVIFSPDTMIEPKDIFALRKKKDGRMRFLPEGFQIDTRGLSWEEVYESLSVIMTELAHSPSLHV